MEYIPRYLERKFTKMSDFFKAILVTGARQVGKTTMLQHIAKGQDRTYVTLDKKAARDMAQNDPALFFQTYKPPILIDEVQYAPELFPVIKILCDESDDKGLFWMTGSQQYKMMEIAGESLAGRVGIINMYSLSQSEKNGITYGEELDFSFDSLKERYSKAYKNDVVSVFEHIWRGGMPQSQGADHEQLSAFFESYVDTYLMKDIKELGEIRDTNRFRDFITACAALVGGIVNYKTLSDACGISQPTAKQWLKILEGLGVIFLLRPYSNNALKRLVKAPKLYFCDTGLAAHLSMWLTPQTLMNGAASGHFFENYVVAELIKNYSYSQSNINMTYLRDSNVKEIDILIEKNNIIHPLEIKKSANPSQEATRKFDILNNTASKIGAGGIICMCEEPIPIDRLNTFIPCNLI